MKIRLGVVGSKSTIHTAEFFGNKVYWRAAYGGYYGIFAFVAISAEALNFLKSRRGDKR